jgi:hypothetical protein
MFVSNSVWYYGCFRMIWKVTILFKFQSCYFQIFCVYWFMWFSPYCYTGAQNLVLEKHFISLAQTKHAPSSPSELHFLEH